MAKKMKEDEGDAEFAPPSEESSDEEEALEIDPQEIALLSGDYEVYDIHGHVTVVHGPELSKAEEEKKETEVVKLAKEDPRYNQATANRQLRFNVIINRAKEASKHKEQAVLDFTDGWQGITKVPKNMSKIVECKVGNFLETGRTMFGATKIRQMDAKEKEDMNKIAGTDSSPCECEICLARRRNSFKMEETAARDKLRSGKKLGWEKYGPGRTL